MKHATLEDFGTIRKLFDAHLDIFPYLRNDTLREKIEGIGGSVVFEDNVVIIYLRYVVRKMIGNARANVGDVVIHELVKGDGGNAKNVIENFFEYVGSPVWTTVRRDNIRAKQFYEKVGMKRVGAILWKNGELEGDVYRTDSLEKFLA
jgi:hypothetical protein|tara:strand:- start:1311 stop:1754 length:444 start_codon:yes stop_codon:yes gene_type:complete